MRIEKIIHCHKRMYAHIPEILDVLDKLIKRVLPLDTRLGLRVAFDCVNETLDRGIVSIIGKDTPFDTDALSGNISPTYYSDSKKDIPSEMQILNDVFNKFAL